MPLNELSTGRIIDTDHISYVSRRTVNLTAGGTKQYTTLHMDNNDLVRLTQAEWTELGITPLSTESDEEGEE